MTLFVKVLNGFTFKNQYNLQWILSLRILTSILNNLLYNLSAQY